jgi:hypothetical protein
LCFDDADWGRFMLSPILLFCPTGWEALGRLLLTRPDRSLLPGRYCEFPMALRCISLTAPPLLTLPWKFMGESLLFYYFEFKLGILALFYCPPERSAVSLYLSFLLWERLLGTPCRFSPRMFIPWLTCIFYWCIWAVFSLAFLFFWVGPPFETWPWPNRFTILGAIGPASAGE